MTYAPPTVFTPEGMKPDERARQQLVTCMDRGDAVAGALMADHHVGYSQPIGGVIAFPEHISPSGVGYDIGCGNKAVATSLLYSDIANDIPKIADEINRRISFGIGRPNDEPVGHPVLDSIASSDLPHVKELASLAAKQLGTVGAGNHYVDLFREEGTDRVWIGVHFGSRGFGHKIASGYLAMAQGRTFFDHPAEGEMDAPPTLLDTRGSLGFLYVESMKLAGDYAYAGRDTVCEKVLEILGNPGVFDEVHNHHNFAWEETIAGTKCWVVRKGCTPLYPGQRGFVGGSMGENAVIVEGRPMEDAGDCDFEAALYSAPHGAGRVMSRTQAAGKARKRWYCRSCGWTQPPATPSPVGGGGKSQARCPSCKRVGNLNKKWVVEKPGAVDWSAVRKRLVESNIELRGGAADEAPEAYKRLPDVLAAHEAHVDVTTQLRPIAVVMAGANTFDPFKD